MQDRFKPVKNFSHAAIAYNFFSSVLWQINFDILISTLNLYLFLHLERTPRQIEGVPFLQHWNVRGFVQDDLTFTEEEVQRQGKLTVMPGH